MKRNVPNGWILALAVACCAALPANAGIFLTTSPAIPGEGTTPGFEGQIEIDSGQWGVGVARTCTETSDPSFSEFTFGASLSSATIPLAEAAIAEYAAEVRARSFPADEHVFADQAPARGRST